jgi:hypothetical protein
MNNERIDEILDDNIVAIEGGMRDRIRKAMEQYGKEVHADGMREGHSHGIVWAEKYSPDLTRLRELVKAQRELIDWMEIRLDDLESHTEYEQLNNRIKELEK